MNHRKIEIEKKQDIKDVLGLKSDCLVRFKVLDDNLNSEADFLIENLTISTKKITSIYSDKDGNIFIEVNDGYAQINPKIVIGGTSYIVYPFFYVDIKKVEKCIICGGSCKTDVCETLYREHGLSKHDDSISHGKTALYFAIENTPKAYQEYMSNKKPYQTLREYFHSIGMESLCSVDTERELLIANFDLREKEIQLQERLKNKK